jgi:hypothetical protein
MGLESPESLPSINRNSSKAAGIAEGSPVLNKVKKNLSLKQSEGSVAVSNDGIV